MCLLASDTTAAGKKKQCEHYLTQAGWTRMPASNAVLPGMLPAAWDSTGFGYLGLAYWRPIPGRDSEAELAFAHRGTKFSEKGNILADIAIAEQKVPQMLEGATLRYVRRILQSDATTISRETTMRIDGRAVTSIVHTGFSLGGFLAAACVGIVARVRGDIRCPRLAWSPVGQR